MDDHKGFIINSVPSLSIINKEKNFNRVLKSLVFMIL